MIIMVNGPPGSGKDEVCRILSGMNFVHMQMKEELFKDTVKYFNVDYDWFMDGYDRTQKEVAEPSLKGMSRRESLIHVSENVMKPQHGKGYYGKRAAENMKDGVDYSFSDSGFVEEVEQIINKFGMDEIIFIRLYRDDCDYSNDSRRYIRFNNLVKEMVCDHKTDISKFEDQFFPEVVDIDGYVVHNNGSKVDLYQTITDIVKAHNDRKNAVKIGF